MELWQRFTHRARRSILIAHDEALQMRQTLIGTEHLLLGLLRLGEGAAAEILRGMSVDIAELREDVVRMAEIGEDEGSSNEIAFTPEAQRALQIAYGESLEGREEHVGTEHLLMGLAREARGAAFRALRKHDVDAGGVRGEILHRATHRPTDSEAEPPPRRETATTAEAVAVAARELLQRAHEAAADMRMHLEKAEGLLQEIAELVEQEAGSDTMDRKTLSSDRIPPAVGPYSQAVRAGDMIFCSGVIGLDPDTGKLVEDSFEAQVRRVLDNMEMLLADCGTSMDAVVKTTVFLVDMSQFSAFNTIYAEYFDETPPARSTVQVAALPLGAQIEVEAIAIA